MSLESLYPSLKAVHVGAAVLSGSLFLARATAGLAGWRHAMHPALRGLSYAIDTVLLSAAVALAIALGQAPFVSAWLTVKLLLLVVYIVLGVIALKRGKTRRVKALALVGAVAVYLFIVSVALMHDARGLVALAWGP